MKRIKFIFAALMLSLGFLFCFCLSVSVSADEGVGTETTDQINVVGVYEYNEEGKGSAKFTLYSDNSFYAELHDLETNETREGKGTYIIDGNILILNTDNGILKCKVNGNTLEPYEESEEIEIVEPNSFLSHLKDLKWDEAEAIIGWIIAYLVANFGVVLSFAITLILKKVNETKQSKAFQEALAKVSLENQEKINALITEFENKLNSINADNQAFIEEQKTKLEALTNDKTIAIATELSKVTDYLNNEDKK